MSSCAPAADTARQGRLSLQSPAIRRLRLANEAMPTYLITMQMRSILGTMALVVPLLAILVAAGWFAASAWVSVQGPPMPAIGYLAMALGVVFSLIVGCGLMALLFYSSRHGYDDPFQAHDDRE
jgi:hypothetical protein